MRLKFKMIAVSILVVLGAVVLSSCEQSNSSKTPKSTSFKTEEGGDRSQEKASQVVICESGGRLLVDEKVLLEGFNKVYKKKALKVGFAYYKHSDEHSLLFYTGQTEAIAIALVKEGGSDRYFLSRNAWVKKYGCLGEPCNACSLEDSWFKSPSCECQEDCDDCRCNQNLTFLEYPELVRGLAKALYEM